MKHFLHLALSTFDFIHFWVPRSWLTDWRLTTKLYSELWFFSRSLKDWQQNSTVSCGFSVALSIHWTLGWVISANEQNGALDGGLWQHPQQLQTDLLQVHVPPHCWGGKEIQPSLVVRLWLRLLLLCVSDSVYVHACVRTCVCLCVCVCVCACV